MAIAQPPLIPQVWGSDGTVGTIPQTTSEVGRASWAEGFPSETALPITEGGIPPSYLDFQGVLHSLSAHNFFQQSGAKYTWSNALEYPAKAVILGSDGNVYEAVQASGPGSIVGAVDPVTDTNRNAWQPYTALPEQTAAETGYVLTTNGSSAEWYDIKADTITAIEQASEGYDGEAGDSPTTAELATELLTKAGTDLANLSVAGKEVAAGASMPNGRTVNISLGASGTTYTAPGTGWIYIRKRASAAGQYVVLVQNGFENAVAWSVSSHDLYAFMPILAGKSFAVNYTADGSNSSEYFRFVYAEGAE